MPRPGDELTKARKLTESSSMLKMLPGGNSTNDRGSVVCV